MTDQRSDALTACAAKIVAACGCAPALILPATACAQISAGSAAGFPPPRLASHEGVSVFVKIRKIAPPFLPAEIADGLRAGGGKIPAGLRGRGGRAKKLGARVTGRGRA